MSAKQRAVALEVAAARMPTELSRMSGEGRVLIARVCGAPSDEATDLAGPFAAFHLGPLFEPLGDCTPKTTAQSSEEEVRTLAELYWRCSIALYQMPLASLQV